MTWIVYGYKDGSTDEFEDASEHAFGPFYDWSVAEDAAEEMQGAWQTAVLEIRPPL